MRRIMLLLLCVVLPLAVFGQTTLNGAGATFPNPMYSKWFSEYHKLHSDVQVNYQPIGSGGGIRQVIAGTVDFGASDMPMTDDQLKDVTALGAEREANADFARSLSNRIRSDAVDADRRQHERQQAEEA